MYSQGAGRRKQIACLLQLNILNTRTSLVPTTSLSYRGKNSKREKKKKFYFMLQHYEFRKANEEITASLRRSCLRFLQLLCQMATNIVVLNSPNVASHCYVCWKSDIGLSGLKPKCGQNWNPFWRFLPSFEMHLHSSTDSPFPPYSTSAIVTHIFSTWHQFDVLFYLPLLRLGLLWWHQAYWDSLG